MHSKLDVIKKKLRPVYRKIKQQVKLTLTNRIYVSFGENCLTDNILDRHGIKSLTSVFSHGRSNIEYILQMERDEYRNFLNPEYLVYETLDEKEVPRLKTYNHLENDYNKLHKNGFEFTHHDVIKDEKLRLKFQNRLIDLKKFIGKKKIIIFYHHRVNDKTDRQRLLKDLNELKEIYSKERKNAELILFTQHIVENESERSLAYNLKQGVHLFTFNTLKEWSGLDPNLLWAKCDEDLISKMLTQVKRI